MRESGARGASRGRVAATLVAAFALAACGDGGVTTPGGETPDVPPAFDTVSDTGFTPVPDTVPDTAAPDVPADVPGVGTEPCQSNADCESGWCVQGPQGTVCTRECDTDCPPGWSCRQVVNAKGDPAFICLYDHLFYCWPCEVDGDCAQALLDISPHRCVPAPGGAGSFCATACEQTSDCPPGAACNPVVDGEETLTLCQPDVGLCECSDPAISAGATTACSATNEHGTCEGTRGCTDEGLSACSAAEPAAEACNGADDDCDGETDEAFPEQGAPCDGDDDDLCEDGAWTCAGGQLACDDDAAAAAEACNDVDDDCDGETDEDFPAKGQPCDGEDEDLCLDGAFACTPEGGVACDDDAASAAEVCNDLDDDCDGETDEGFPTKGQPCDGDDDDACPDGAWVCGPDGGLACEDPPGTSAELCNGIDDDCDGLTDEDFPTLGSPCDGEDEDGCPDGAVVCGATGGTVCDDDGASVPEVCNDLDDDCDGETDEGFPTKGQPCDGDDADLCPDGVLVCDGAGLACQDDPASAVEACNGLDDDCDGETDEDFPQLGQPCDGADDDLCADGAWACAPDGGVACEDDPASAVEVCNDLDDDCDGETDEDFPDKGAPCDGEDADLCPDGALACDGLGLTCVDGPEAAPELCNGFDDDCDGQTDEDFPTLGLSCDGGDADLCADGEWTCDGVGVVCVDDPASAPELCNGLDDDCDSLTDETFPTKGQPCDGADADQCKDGVLACDGVGLVCNDDAASAVELCNGEDDDCDGLTDETFPTKGQPCDGADADQCADGAWTCDGVGLVCSDDANSKVEACNDKDDDCDGLVDQTFLEKGTPCDGVDADQCPDGTWVCNGVTLICNDDGATKAEVCNGLDDDCDGQTDEGFELKGAPCDGPDLDKCEDGVWVCDGAGLVCNDDAASGTEICNDIDDDCDGLIDEGIPLKGQACDGPDADSCADGAWVCDGAGGVICNDGPTTPNAIEICNDADDDCDGLIDEDFPTKGQSCDGNDGDLCKEGQLICNGTILTCSDTTSTTVETCNNQDDDCDGQTDESVTRSCSTGCGSGIETCSAGSFGGCTAPKPITCFDYGICANAQTCGTSCPSAPAEKCNLVDDDCDGQTDEGFYGDASNGNVDFPNAWFGPEIAAYPGSKLGSVAGRLLPQDDRDWWSVYAVEDVSDFCIPGIVEENPLTATIVFNSPGSGLWYEVCACWSGTAFCDRDQQGAATCATSVNGATVTIKVEMDMSCGSEDSGYLDVEVRPDTPSLDKSCSNWSASWSMSEPAP